MSWVPDSRTAGYLGPEQEPRSPVGDSWEDFLHDLFAGITGLDPTLVRPLWQPEPPNQPEFLIIDWLAFGVVSAELDFDPYVGHSPSGDGGLGQDLLQEHEVDTIQCTFTGPHAERYASYLRRGLYIWQNRAVLRANAVGLVEVTAYQHMPEKITEQWINRVDLDVVLRREIRYNYAVRNVVRAISTVIETDAHGEQSLTLIDTLFIPSEGVLEVTTTPDALVAAGTVT